MLGIEDYSPNTKKILFQERKGYMGSTVTRRARMYTVSHFGLWRMTEMFEVLEYQDIRTGAGRSEICDGRGIKSRAAQSHRYRNK